MQPPKRCDLLATTDGRFSDSEIIFRPLCFILLLLLCACSSDSRSSRATGNDAGSDEATGFAGTAGIETDGVGTADDGTEAATTSTDGSSEGETDASSGGDSSGNEVPVDPDGNQSKTPICDQEEVEVAGDFIPPNILLVVDRSGSMGGTKWTLTKAAIKDVLEDLGNQVKVGILMYPAQKSCTVPDGPQVPFGFAQAELIETTMNDIGTGGSTPMGKAMVVAREWLESEVLVGETAVILAADGKPSDMCLEDCTGCDCTDPATCMFCADLIECTYNEVKNQVSALMTHGIKTYVVGFEGGFGATDFLTDLATEGGTANVGSSAFYDAEDGSSLASALKEIAGNVDACAATFVPPEQYDFVVVSLDGTVVKRDPAHENGWDFVDDNTIRFYGQACVDAGADNASLVITFVCKQ